MRVGLNTLAFGNVEIVSTVRASGVGLVVGSEKGDLHALFSSELPAIAHNLELHSLRLQSVSFERTQAFSSQTGSDGSQRQPIPKNQHHSLSTSPSVPDQPSQIGPLLPTASGGLSVLA